MVRVVVILLAASLCAAATPPGAAIPLDRTHVHERGDPHYPMSADRFRAFVGASERKAHENLEWFIDDRGLSAAQADAIRARFEIARAEVDKGTTRVCSDGVVSRREADDVHRLLQKLLREIRAEA